MLRVHVRRRTAADRRIIRSVVADGNGSAFVNTTNDFDPDGPPDPLPYSAPSGFKNLARWSVTCMLALGGIVLLACGCGAATWIRYNWSFNPMGR
jgi:hypothetical protein